MLGLGANKEKHFVVTLLFYTAGKQTKPQPLEPKLLVLVDIILWQTYILCGLDSSVLEPVPDWLETLIEQLIANLTNLLGKHVLYQKL